jgi:hypothetical protein
MIWGALNRGAQGMVAASPGLEAEVMARIPGRQIPHGGHVCSDALETFAEDSDDRVGPANKPGNHLRQQLFDGT